MACYNNCYLPRPPREWSRVQNSCSLIIDSATDFNEFIQLPYTGKIVPLSSFQYEIAMLNKGNILQYKKNSSNLTKNQRYSQIAKGKWTNRNTTWAIQSTRGYTNPNVQNLKRVGAINITLDGTPIDLPISCPQYPPNFSQDSSFVIQDFGTLICNVQEDICTGQIKSQPANNNCNLTSDSDVPGTIQSLCWNDGIQTWYPRQRYIMTNSGNKWPINAPLFSAIFIPSPIIESYTNIDNDISLNWAQPTSCLPITNFIIYQNNLPIQIIEPNIFTYKFTISSCGNYKFYITSKSTNIESEPSNIISINIIC